MRSFIGDIGAFSGRALGAAAVIMLASFACPAARADGTVPGILRASAGPPIAELRSQYAGSYRYAGDAKEQQARLDAIDRSVSSFFFAVRGMARASIEDRTRIMPTCKFEFPSGKIASTVPGHAVAVSPETGAPAPYRVEDDAIVLTQRFEGSHLVQVFKADEGGTRKNEFSLSPDGKLLFMKATLSSPKLSIPVVYTLTYRRVEATN
jgi:hypothetical protein